MNRMKRVLAGLVVAVPLRAGECALAAGGAQSAALTPDGRVLQWGEQGGPLPSPVYGIEEVRAIAAGHRHTLALRQDGTVWAWGYNDYGQLGDGSGIRHDRPVQARGLTGVAAVAAGSYQSYALKNDGTVWAWGDNRNGQLGDGTRLARRTPVLVEHFLDIQAVAAGATHVLVLRRDGTVCSWGLAQELPTDAAPRSGGNPVPACLSGFSGVRAIAAGGASSYALKQDGTVWVWGPSLCGADIPKRDGLPEQPVLNRVRAIAAGTLHLLALRDDGSVWACGGNDAGQIGDGSTLTRASPVEVRGLFSVTHIAAGFRHSLAKSASGTFSAWGDNSAGQLATGDRNPRLAPTAIWDGTGELSRP